MASVSGFGQEGPLAHKTSFDLIAQAMSGMMYVTGEADGPPLFVGAGIGDCTAGFHAFAAIGFLIGARLTSTEVAGGWMNFVQLPMWLLSGSFFSYERFPEWLQLPIRFLPLTAVNDALGQVEEASGQLMGGMPGLSM
jgi:hypothetical protein